MWSHFREETEVELEKKKRRVDYQWKKGEMKAPLDFKLMLLCVQAVTTKGHPKHTTRQMIIIIGGEPELCGMCSTTWLSELYALRVRKPCPETRAIKTAFRL